MPSQVEVIFRAHIVVEFLFTRIALCPGIATCKETDT